MLKKHLGHIALGSVTTAGSVTFLYVIYGKKLDFYSHPLPIYLSLIIIMLSATGIASGILGLVFHRVLTYEKIQIGFCVLSILTGSIIAFAFSMLLLILF